MDIKGKIIEILAKENHTFSQLAEYLQLSEDELTQELNNKTLELRNLEAISKALRAPLYSFFRPDGVVFDYKPKSMLQSMFSGNDEGKTPEQLSEEIFILKQLLAIKEERLQKLNR